MLGACSGAPRLTRSPAVVFLDSLSCPTQRPIVFAPCKGEEPPAAACAAQRPAVEGTYTSSLRLQPSQLMFSWAFQAVVAFRGQRYSLVVFPEASGRVASFWNEISEAFCFPDAASFPSCLAGPSAAPNRQLLMGQRRWAVCWSQVPGSGQEA